MPAGTTREASSSAFRLVRVVAVRGAGRRGEVLPAGPHHAHPGGQGGSGAGVPDVQRQEMGYGRRRFPREDAPDGRRETRQGQAKGQDEG